MNSPFVQLASLVTTVHMTQVSDLNRARDIGRPDFDAGVIDCLLRVLHADQSPALRPDALPTAAQKSHRA
ncbi:hypothetical protein [Streptomyces shenzhenensis]|uniref:Uncharacterized protein n=1 Tax=Streptomyces shenzhenensis TaxID=943815 RepID=A0A3M0I5W7_9ACTN|nr:hypothetical protein [Streptomyces shenzhenensis]RMB81519.1 hypothetical protein CTZ28_34520 [Streptomyces shenzhenensis]